MVSEEVGREAGRDEGGMFVRNAIHDTKEFILVYMMWIGSLIYEDEKARCAYLSPSIHSIASLSFIMKCCFSMK